MEEAKIKDFGASSEASVILLSAAEEQGRPPLNVIDDEPVPCPSGAISQQADVQGVVRVIPVHR